ncbi:thiamine pyrophosphokinase [Thamnocephalis sphaerospora]|uniref:Thiamine pyrophosphokinase n=1 Tax=Thamnocephalis sphaerospora TaxID=78915 RepID=A0A4P9XJL2_9FUNG|nr:thiamine pyrophosphokinase [Thamnocephalis sphaerospora]|eukprot:RKP05561.1 thiamine pyrophosphokinase [Thamnocephalis sphaerospora]
MHTTTQWEFAAYLRADTECRPYAVILLNQPLDSRHWPLLWTRAQVRLCADGGINSLYDATACASHSIPGAVYPEFLCGDMDSALAPVVAWFEAKGVEVCRIADQNSTDFEKCIRRLEHWEHEHCLTESPVSLMPIIVLGALSGRFDHCMHAINVLHKQRSARRIYLMSEASVAFLLDEGEHTIHVDRSLEGPTCGLLPVGIAHATLSTTGLRWNLDGADTRFGGMVSTSNALDQDTVTISTTAPLIWTVALQ